AADRAAGQGARGDRAAGTFGDRTGRGQRSRGAVDRTIDRQVTGGGGQRRAGAAVDGAVHRQRLRVGQVESSRGEAAQRADQVGAVERGAADRAAGQRGRGDGAGCLIDVASGTQGDRVADQVAGQDQVRAGTGGGQGEVARPAIGRRRVVHRQGLRVVETEIAARGERTQRAHHIGAVERRAADRAAGQGARGDRAAGTFGDRTRRGQRGRGAVDRAVDRQVAGGGLQRRAGAAVDGAVHRQCLRVGQGEIRRREVAQRADQVGAVERGAADRAAGQGGRGDGAGCLIDVAPGTQGDRVADQVAGQDQVRAGTGGGQGEVARPAIGRRRVVHRQGLRVVETEIAARGECTQRAHHVATVERRAADRAAGQGARGDRAAGTFGDRTGRGQRSRGAVDRTIDRQVTGGGGQRRAGAAVDGAVHRQRLRVGQVESSRGEAAQRADQVGAVERGAADRAAGQRGRGDGAGCLIDVASGTQGDRVADQVAGQDQVRAGTGGGQGEVARPAIGRRRVVHRQGLRVVETEIAARGERTQRAHHIGAVERRAADRAAGQGARGDRAAGTFGDRTGRGQRGRGAVDHTVDRQVAGSRGQRRAGAAVDGAVHRQRLRVGQREVCRREIAQGADQVGAVERGRTDRAAGQGARRDDAAAGDRTRRGQRGRGAVDRAVDRQVAGGGLQRRAGAAVDGAVHRQCLRVGQGEIRRREVAQRADQVGAVARGAAARAAGQGGRGDGAGCLIDVASGTQG